jgi:hypothetical protein
MRVDTSNEVPRKWPSTKTKAIRIVRPTPSAYADPHATPVMRKNSDRRYVKAGSARWYEFLVSIGDCQFIICCNCLFGGVVRFCKCSVSKLSPCWRVKDRVD